MHEFLDQVRDYESGIFLLANSPHTPFLDIIFLWASNRFIWIPLYVFFLWMLYRKYPKNFWMILIACALLITVNDQLCNIVKQGVARLRPTHDTAISPFVQIVGEYRGGKYGFFSAHAANSFAVATFVVCLCREKYRLLLPIALGYAMLVSYSRIYLGVHYPSDVLAGATVGITTGWLLALLYKLCESRVENAVRRCL
ncbi:MAG: phosphatase PAP2 family protein [Bacteroidales bacterium]|jgi:undecaprenyl-diphosphatase|nr:phosphatase PAP2 family protein [Bacteroidales bacterium]